MCGMTHDVIAAAADDDVGWPADWLRTLMVVYVVPAKANGNQIEINVCPFVPVAKAGTVAEALVVVA